MEPIQEPTVALILEVPDEFFKDEDHRCIAAAYYVCNLLEKHLIENDHTIPEHWSGGGEEDWGVMFRSQHRDETFNFNIALWPDMSPNDMNQVYICYYLRTSFWKSLFGKQSMIDPSHAIHEVMTKFCQDFKHFRQLTQSQFDKEI